MSNSTSKPATTMAELMAKSKSSIVTLQKGQLVEGTITRLTSSEIFVDIGSKTHAMVLEKDRRIFRYIMSVLKVGDKVEVSVLSAESEYGYPVVSLRRFVDKLMWGKLQKAQDTKEKVSVTVTSKTAGGYIVVTSDGISGFLPNSQSLFQEDPVNKKIGVYVLEIQKENKKVVFSQKPLMDKEAFEKATKSLKRGQKIVATVTATTSFGMFVTVSVENLQLDGLVHISEIAWERSETALAEYTAGQKIEAELIGIDADSKRLDLSIKRLTKDPFEELMGQYGVDQKVNGTVTKMTSMGVQVEIAQGVEGFIRKEKIPPTVSYTEGQEVTATITEIDKRRHRLVLTPVLKEKPIGYR